MAGRLSVGVAVGVLLLWLSGWLVGGPVRQFERAAGLVGMSGEFTADRCVISAYEDGPPPADCRGVFRPDGGGAANGRARIWSGASVGLGVRAVCEGDECFVVSAAEVARSITLISLTLLPGALGLLVMTGLGLGAAGEKAMIVPGVAAAVLVLVLSLAGISWFVLAVSGF
ncbi:hypothetical protein PUR71_25040 [Streptomyces sp. SP17BM10]|uniref:hypothetical protein n=1 Tax=Streptomyces sp. SP17BM10 TaxID=3002530 RepID=UPI002E7A9ACD|nr:hypothetical protein [Streptomyces sp. SP17BM10]MEE1786139.1 hypothetical protein [Streptomyces sp. SP17BM10]